MSTESRSRVDGIDIDRLRNDPEKLHEVAKDLKQRLLESYNELDTLKRTSYPAKATFPCPAKSKLPPADPCLHWPGRLWVPAETSYPSDYDGSLSCFTESRIEILTFNCLTNELITVTGLQEVYNKKALFTSLPSRFARQLRVCIEKIPPAEARGTPRYRVTEKQVPKDMSMRYVVHLSNLPPLTRCKVMMGVIKWIFIFNASKALTD